MAKREETLQMAILYREGGMSLRQIGDRYGITRQTVGRRLASLEIALPARPPRYAHIDKARLEFLYWDKKLAVDKIARIFGISRYIINQALEFHKIPGRKSISSNGKHIDLLRELEVGGQTQTECRSRQPYVVLHGSAKRAGIKISVKSLGGGNFSVIRLA